MLKVGDRVKYIGSTNSGWNKWLYNRPGIIVGISYYCDKVQYEEDYNTKNAFWLLRNELKLVIPKYILDWKRKLNA